MRTDQHSAPAPHAPVLRVPAPWASDPSLGEQLAAQWVATHRPGREVARARTHSTLYRGPDDLSTRVGVRLDADAVADELTLLVRDHAGEVSVAEFPDDPFLPTLADVLRRDVAEPIVRSILPGNPWDAALPDYRALVVHHPREGACVLRLQLGGAEAYAKVYPRAENATAAADVLYAVGSAEVVAPGGDVVRLPRLLGVSATLRATFLESLTSHGPRSDGSTKPSPVSPVEAARALRAFHEHTPSGRLPLVPASVHVARVQREQQLVVTAWPDVAERVDEPIRTVASVLDAFAPPAALPPVLCHGDFTQGQLVRMPRGLGLLDLDTVSLGDPASDIGRYLAYEEMRGGPSEYSSSRAAATRAAFVDAYGPAPGGVEDSVGFAARVWAHRRLNLALIALRAARRFKGARSALALTLLDTRDPIPGRLP